MTDIEICKGIVATGSCRGYKCNYCPLNNVDVYDCLNYDSKLLAARAYLDGHKQWEPKSREDVFIRNDATEVWSRRTFIIKHNNKIYCTSTQGGDLVAWNYCKPIPKEKVWRWAYQSNDLVAISTNYCTEENAKKKFGDKAVKLSFTEKEK